MFLQLSCSSCPMALDLFLGKHSCLSKLQFYILSKQQQGGSKWNFLTICTTFIFITTLIISTLYTSIFPLFRGRHLFIHFMNKYLSTGLRILLYVYFNFVNQSLITSRSRSTQRQMLQTILFLLFKPIFTQYSVHNL